MNNEQYYIYGKLNQSEILKEYEGKETDTANTITDNTSNTISVDVKKVPNKLKIFNNRYPLSLIEFDGSEFQELDLSDYVDETSLVNMKNYLLSQDFDRAELKSESDKKNILHFYRANGEEITSVELSGFTQVQSDLSETIPTNEAFVKNKSTEYLTNAGPGEKDPSYDGSIYATQKWTQDEISKHSIDLDVVKDISLIQNETPDYLAIKKDIINLNSREEKSEDVTIPVATNSKSGLMSSADVNSISDLKSRVGNLEGKTTRLLYSENENPTIEQINAFVESAGYTSPFEGIAVVVDKTFHIWHYYENIGWQDDGQDTVSNFTNNIAGIIKGSEIEGRIYAENDGTGSLVGYDNLKNKTNIIKNDGTGNQYLSNDGTYKTIRTNRQFNSTWKIDGTTLEFIQSILADSSATVGMSYLGGVKFTDLPTGTSGIKLNNAECLVEVISSTLGENVKIIHLDLYSANTPPYHWTTIYYTSLPEPIWSPDVMESEITELNTELDKKQNKLTAGENITIQDNVISVDGKIAKYFTGTNIELYNKIASGEFKVGDFVWLDNVTKDPSITDITDTKLVDGKVLMQIVDGPHNYKKSVPMINVYFEFRKCYTVILYNVKFKTVETSHGTGSYLKSVTSTDEFSIYKTYFTMEANPNSKVQTVSAYYWFVSVSALSGIHLSSVPVNERLDAVASILKDNEKAVTSGAVYTELEKKQNTLSTSQLQAVNSGATEEKINQIATNTTNIALKQDKLTNTQLTAVNSGITDTKVAQIATNTTNIASLQTGKQDKLTAGENITIENNVISAKGGDLTNYYTKEEVNSMLPFSEDISGGNA